MKDFIKDISLFSALLCAVFVIGLAVPDMSSVQNMHYSMLDKEKALRETKGPRLILVGGSNITYGIDSARIQDDLRINTLNTGIHAGYGLKFMLDYVRPYIKPGDVVVLAPEYEYFFNDFYLGGGQTLLYAIGAVPDNFRYLTLSQILSLAEFVPGYAVGKLKTLFFPGQTTGELFSDRALYERRAFNKYGDLTVHWDKPRLGFSSESLKGEKVDAAALRTLKDFQSYIERNGAGLYIAYPCLNMGSFALSESRIRLVERELMKYGFKTLSGPERYVFTDDLFFNFRYHLNKKGVDIRTGYLIEDLKQSGI